MGKNSQEQSKTTESGSEALKSTRGSRGQRPEHEISDNESVLSVTNKSSAKPQKPKKPQGGKGGSQRDEQDPPLPGTSAVNQPTPDILMQMCTQMLAQQAAQQQLIQQQGAGFVYPGWPYGPMIGAQQVHPMFGPTWEDQSDAGSLGGAADDASVDDADDDAAAAVKAKDAAAKNDAAADIDGTKSEGKPGKPKFVLDDVGDSKLAEYMRELQAEQEDKDKVGIQLNHNVAVLLDKMCSSKFSGKDLQEICKKYPPPVNTTRVITPKLEREVVIIIDSNPKTAKAVKDEDQRWVYQQQDIAAAMAAIAPIGDLMMTSAVDHPELNDLSSNFKDAMQLLSSVLSFMSKERRDKLGGAINPEHFKLFCKKLEEGGSPDYLFGGNLQESTMELETAKKTARYIRKEVPQGQAQVQGGGKAKKYSSAPGASGKPYPSNSGWRGPRPQQQQVYGMQSFNQPFLMMNHNQMFRPRGPRPQGPRPQGQAVQYNNQGQKQQQQQQPSPQQQQAFTKRGPR